MVQARVRAAGLEMLPQQDLMRSGPQPFNVRSKSILAALDDLPDGDADILAVLVGVGLWRAERTPQGEPALQAGSRAGAPPSIRQGLERDRPCGAPGGAVKPLRRDGARRRRHRIRRWRPVLGVAAIVMTAAADSLVIV